MLCVFFSISFAVTVVLVDWFPTTTVKQTTAPLQTLLYNLIQIPVCRKHNLIVSSISRHPTFLNLSFLTSPVSRQKQASAAWEHLNSRNSKSRSLLHTTNRTFFSRGKVSGLSLDLGFFLMLFPNLRRLASFFDHHATALTLRFCLQTG